MTNKPPALEAKTTSEFVSALVSGFNAARKAFPEADFCNRVKERCALKHAKTTDLFQDQAVYYKTERENRCRRPANIIGVDNAVIFLRHGGSMLKVHCSRLRKCVENNVLVETVVPVSERSRSAVIEPISVHLENKQSKILWRAQKLVERQV